ncbi:hypothetical protein PUN28_013145 [Cardiocondyla obscurior]|uniref:Uncharacterized protein n=1 Tax=Cardiocondyla obscurior TaxID=286306 RepID=A0AAW2F8G8_9HYME
MQHRSRYLSRPSCSLSLPPLPPPFLPKAPRRIHSSFFQRSKPLRHYINALIGVVLEPETLGTRREERASERETQNERTNEREREREKESRIAGIICPPARAIILPDPPAISRSSSSVSPPPPPCPTPSLRSLFSPCPTS